jgi:hypothetical protein
MDGDRFAVITSLVQNKELEEIWSKPWAFHRMLQNFPVLEGIKGFPELMAKDKEELTSEDVRRRKRRRGEGGRME